MVAHDYASLAETLTTAVTGAGRSGGRYTCPYCRMPNLTEREMYFHCPAFHINYPNNTEATDECPICRIRTRGPLQVKFQFLPLSTFLSDQR
jgi:rubrerythrin